jgi:hypothetical protein
VLKIVSGGQTGVDRAALDVAMELGFPVRGWCPLGRLAEDGKIPNRYPLCETPSSHMGQRTQWNIRDTDATLILSWGAPTGGTFLTLNTCRRTQKLHALLDLTRNPDPQITADWIQYTQISSLNVAGPRASKAPLAYQAASDFLRAVLALVKATGSLQDSLGEKSERSAGSKD